MSQDDKGARAPAGAYVKRSIFGVVVALQCAAFAAALWYVGLGASTQTGSTAQASASPRLVMASCSGSVDKSPDDSPWMIPLDHCDKAIDDMEVKSAFLQKWTICGGANSFAISLNPRAVAITSDHFNCSRTKSEVTVTYLGFAKN
jgi:hypothetical protein